MIRNNFFLFQVEPPIRRSLRCPVENGFPRFTRVTELIFTFIFEPDLSREVAVAAAERNGQERREKVARRPDIFRMRHDHVAGLAITQTAPRVIGARMIDGPLAFVSCPRNFGEIPARRFVSAVRSVSLSKVGND